jgi:transcriptional regulator
MSLYLPKHFASDDAGAMARLIREHPFATLVTPAEPEPAISHVPLVQEGERPGHATLVGHFARANPHVALAASRPSIAIFHGPHAYVSASFYAEPAAAVPTWNYAVVHAHGTLELVDERETHAIVERLVERFESARAAPWRIGLAGRELGAMLGAIVGFRMRITRLDAKFKLSQNRSVEDRRRVIGALAAEGYSEAGATSRWMRLHASPGDAER